MAGFRFRFGQLCDFFHNFYSSGLIAVLQQALNTGELIPGRALPVALHTPSEVKAAVSGNGAADKKQVTIMVSKLLRLSEPPKPADAADALALALCHLLRSPMLARIAAAERRVAGAGR